MSRPCTNPLPRCPGRLRGLPLRFGTRRDALRLNAQCRAGDGGEGAKSWRNVLTEIKTVVWSTYAWSSAIGHMPPRVDHHHRAVRPGATCTPQRPPFGPHPAHAACPRHTIRPGSRPHLLMQDLHPPSDVHGIPSCPVRVQAILGRDGSIVTSPGYQGTARCGTRPRRWSRLGRVPRITDGIGGRDLSARDVPNSTAGLFD